MVNESTVYLSDLNAYVTCNICKGYLIDAVSITECLHPFCKSCIVNHLAKNNKCPVCHILIHQSHPLNYISADRTLQDIVYKIVPDLKEKEKSTRKSFYRSIGQSPPLCEDLLVEHDKFFENEKQKLPESSNHNNASYQHDPFFHRNDDQVNIHLESGSDSLKPLRLKYIRLSSKATVTHLRKYVAQQILDDISKFTELDIFILNNDAGTFLGRDHVLKFVRVVYWNEDDPMPLQYRISRKLI